MVFLISIGMVILFILACKESLRKNPVPYTIAAVWMAAAVVLVEWCKIPLPDVVDTWLWPVFSHGGLGGAFFLVVMVTGAFPNGSRPMRWLMPIRGQLSILASILTLGHNIAYGKLYFVRLVTRPDTLPRNQLLAALCSVLMIVIMLPLFITSFMTIRKRMKPKSWKQLQRFAYLFYGLLCAHILLLTVPGVVAGRKGYWLTVFVYGTVFASYGVCRILKAWSVKKRKGEGLANRQKVSVVCCSVVAFFAVAILSVGVVPRLENPSKQPEGLLVQDTVGESISLAAQNAEEESVNLPISSAEDKDSLGIYRDGVFSGSGMGMNTEIKVSVTIEAGVMVDITIDFARDDEPYFTEAEAVIADILENNSADVDTVSGATYSSGGILDAVADALEKAGR
ncbi:MAG: FMN-binding protein [Lachnospiraceae bacterium]|nr:FMN-binding protein [Lachnospiraceae bacterium]